MLYINVHNLGRLFLSLTTAMSSFVDTTTLTACFLVERNATTLYYNFDRSAAAVQLALEHANEMILPQNITLQTVITDIGPLCSPRNHALAYAMNLFDKGINCNVYIGPGCGYNTENVYDLASFHQTLIIGCPSGGVGTSAPLTSYPFLTRISIAHTNTARMLIRFLREQSYTTPVFIQDISTNYFNQLRIMVADLIHKEEDLEYGLKMKFIDVNATELKCYQIHEHLLHNKNRTRVFILLLPSTAVRCFLLQAQKIGMTKGDYVFYAVKLFPSVVWGNYSWSHRDSQDKNAREAFRVLLLSSAKVSTEGSFDLFSKAVKKLSHDTGTFQYEKGDEVDIVTTHFYDAVIYYASMVRDLDLAGRDYTNGLELMDIYKNFTFYSPVNGITTIHEDGDRMSAFLLKNFDPVSGEFQSYISYLPNGSSLVLGPFNWPNGKQFPPGTPYCGFNGDHPRCTVTLSQAEVAVAAVFATLIFLIGIMCGLSLFRRYVTLHSDPFWWRIWENDLQIAENTLHPGFSSGTTHHTHKNISTKTNSHIQSLKIGEDAKVPINSELDVEQTSLSTAGMVLFNNNLVELRALPTPQQRANKTIGQSLLPLRLLQHQNIQRFLGLAVNDENLCEYIVGDLCSKGTLTRLLLHDTLNLDWIFKCSLFKHSAEGMIYLHSSKLISLGNLSSDSCLIDSNFVLKICDYGLWYFRPEEEFAPLMQSYDDRDFESLLWRAPEFLRQRMPAKGSQKGDVYSYSILLQQILLRARPFGNADGTHTSNLAAKELLLEISKRTMPPVRPRIPVSSCSAEFLDLIEQSWDEVPVNRPSFTRIRNHMKRIIGKAGDNVVEHLIRSMEKNATQLEAQAEARTREFMDEKQRSDDVLAQILPKSVAEKLSKGQVVLTETYESTTVHFSDILGFTELLAEAQTPLNTVNILNALYMICDEVIDRFDVYKVEMVKDAYLVASGIPVRNGIRHADEIASMGLMLRREVSAMKMKVSASSQILKLRIGIHSGSCVGAVIGTKMPRYLLFGDTVNTSSRMESHGEPGKIQCSSATKELLDQIGGYHLAERGIINIKGKGNMKTYWVIAKEA